MAGFFGLFDYSKPGKGVRKDEPQGSRFTYFWKLVFRKFWKLIQLNLLYLLFCIPIVTIGPATAGFVYVLRNMANEQPVFMFSDFWDAFKLNWKQSFVTSLLYALAAFILTVSIQFYFHNSQQHSWMFIPAALSLFVAFMLVLMSYYIMLMIVTLDLPLKAIIKNAAIMSILCLKTNILTFLFTGIILAATVLFFPITILLVIVLFPAFIGFIICYNSYPGIQKYAIDPFMAAQEEKSLAESEEDKLFNDEIPNKEAQ